MGGSEPPYMYDPPTRSRQSVAYPYSDFNPRAVTQAHYTALAERAERQRFRAAQNGRPLINFNQHPDSYMAVPSPNSNHKPMPANTKTAIKATRWVQFVLRCFQQLGAMTVLGCFVCLKMKLDATGWIVRVAPAYDIVVTLYAIYHLARPAKSRPPGSSASYHVFATLMDAGLAPFYVFLFLAAMYDLEEPTDADARWTVFFNASDPASVATLLSRIAMLASAVMMGLHTVSIAFDIYLAVVFRKISNLPPDMNPLEDNLTGRPARSFRHKHKNSELTLVGDEEDEKNRDLHMSGSTLSVSNDSRSSLAKAPETRSIPFSHSRMNSDNSFSPHNPVSARYSQQQYDQTSIYHDARSARSSRQDLSTHGHSRSGSISPTKLSSFVEVHEIPQAPAFKDRTNSPRPISSVTVRRNERPASPSLPILHPMSDQERAQRQQRQGLLSDNWYALEDDASADLSNHLQRKPVPYSDSQPTFLPHLRHDSLDPEPLKMNPPTPPPPASQPTASDVTYPDPENDTTLHHNPGPQHTRQDPMPAVITASSEVARTGTVLSHTSSVYSDTPSSEGGVARPSNATPKGKYYGDLAAATRGVLGGRGSPSPTRRGGDAGAGRVVSRSGVDVVEMRGEGKRRQVSGKVAEEGRGWELWKR